MTMHTSFRKRGFRYVDLIRSFYIYIESFTNLYFSSTDMARPSLRLVRTIQNKTCVTKMCSKYPRSTILGAMANTTGSSRALDVIISREQKLCRLRVVTFAAAASSWTAVLKLENVGGGGLRDSLLLIKPVLRWDNSRSNISTAKKLSVELWESPTVVVHRKTAGRWVFRHCPHPLCECKFLNSVRICASSK